MSTKVAFVAAIGRVSVGAESALPKIQSIVGKFGGKVTGGVGSSQDPIMAEFPVSENAAKAAQQAFYLDDVEEAKVIMADASDAVVPVAPPENPAPRQDQGPSDTWPKDYGITESKTAIDAVVAGKEVKGVVEALLSEKKEKKDEKEKEKGDKDADKEDKDEKKEG